MSHPTGTARSISLDLYRALACGMIVFYHLPPNSSPVGLGQATMELFFVLSGYLISKSLVKSIESQGLRGVLGFSIRRVRRLMPAMAGFVIGAAVLNLGLEKASAGEVATAGAAALFGWYNFYQCLAAPAVIGFGGIWSLSLEEQFYFLSVVIVLVCGAFGRKSIWWLLVLAAVLLGAGLVFRFLALIDFYRLRVNYLSYLPPLRLWGFGLGVAVVIAERYRSAGDVVDFRTAVITAALCLIALGGLVWSVKRYDAQAFAFEWAMVPVLGAVLVYVWPPLDGALIAWRNRLIVWPVLAARTLLEAGRGVRIFGKASYSIYLWHCLVLTAFFEMRWHDSVAACFSMAALSIVFGLLSWYFIERRFYQFV